MITGEWPVSGMNAPLIAAPATNVTLNVMS
jgi:hypothetical protein